MHAKNAKNEIIQRMDPVVRAYGATSMEHPRGWQDKGINSAFVNLHGLSADRKAVNVLDLILTGKVAFTTEHARRLEEAFDKALERSTDCYYYRTYRGALIFNTEGSFMGVVDLHLVQKPNMALAARTDLETLRNRAPAEYDSVLLEMVVHDFEDFPALFAEEIEFSEDLK